MFQIDKDSPHTRAVIEKAQNISGDSRGARMLRDYAVAYRKYLKRGDKKILQEVRAKYKPASPEPTPKAEATRDLAELKRALEEYKVMYQHYPEGDLQTKLAEMSGNNPQEVSFLLRLKPSNKAEADGKKAAEAPWGTLYRIMIKEDNAVVKSAGPDKEFGTKDDISSKGIDGN